MPHDIVDKFSTHLKDVLTRALCFVVELDEKTIQPEHLLWAMGTQKGCIGAEVLKRAGIKAADLKELVGARSMAMSLPAPADLKLQLSDDAKRIIEKAVLTANIYGHRYIGTEHLLAGILQINPAATDRFFRTLHLDLKEMSSQLDIVLKSTSKFPEIASAPTNAQTQIAPQKTQSTDEAPKRVSALEYFAVELTSKDAQAHIDPVIGRDREIERLMEILCRRTKNNPLLLGEPGVGKTAIVEGFAKRIVEGSVPPALAHKRVFSLDLPLLVAGTVYRGEFEARLRQIIDEAAQNPDTVLFIDEIHAIVGTGSASGSMDAANMLKPALARGDIRCIGATTPGEFKKYIEGDAALERRFQTVLVEEPSPATAVEILEGVAPYYERFHRVRITHDAIVRAVHLSHRYVQDKQLPDKAIDLMDEAAAAMRVRDRHPGPAQRERELRDALEDVRQKKRQAVVEERFEEASRLKEEEARLTAHLATAAHDEDTSPIPAIAPEDIARVVSRATGIPLEDLVASDKTELGRMEAVLRERVLGQDAVLETVAGALRRAKTGVAHPDRPLASFLFLGPSGVGKTELAKTIAQTLFSSPHHLVRLDMSEYADGFTMSKLIGSPPGFVGYKEAAHLTDRVKQRPYCVVLFDEIEKAHRDVQNLLLQILEEGELTDATGRRVNFKNTIIVLTSNVGLERFARGDMGFSHGEEARALSLTQDLKTELQERFRPELLNRLDHTCVFQPLSRETLAAIVDKQLQELAKRLRGQGLDLDFRDSLLTHLCESIDPSAGARHVRSLIQNRVEHKIAERLSKKDQPAKLVVAIKNGAVHVVKGR